ncbi:MAG: copper resistance protein CopC, partial [Bacillati bacterium ANGP1]
MRWTPASALAALGVMAFAFPAGAHALLRDSEPGAGAVLQRAPQHVTITFTEQPEPKLSIIQVLDSSGRPVDQGPAQAVPGHPLDLTVPVGPLPQGTYTVSWRTVSQVDGHVTGGAFAFGIGVAPPPAQQSQVTAPPPSPGAVASRWAMYVGLSGLFGGAWLWTLALPESPARVRG